MQKAESYMEGMAAHKVGKVGDMTAGLPPYDYTEGSAYLEWYSEENGRVVVELGSDQVQVIGTPVAACSAEPISRKEQEENMTEFLGQCARDLFPSGNE
jgi:hypothetical protein